MKKMQIINPKIKYRNNFAPAQLKKCMFLTICNLLRNELIRQLLITFYREGITRWSMYIQIVTILTLTQTPQYLYHCESEILF